MFYWKTVTDQIRIVWVCYSNVVLWTLMSLSFCMSLKYLHRQKNYATFRRWCRWFWENLWCVINFKLKHTQNVFVLWNKLKQIKIHQTVLGYVILPYIFVKVLCYNKDLAFFFHLPAMLYNLSLFDRQFDYISSLPIKITKYYVLIIHRKF